jgi:hypothetical protein
MSMITAFYHQTFFLWIDARVKILVIIIIIIIIIQNLFFQKSWLLIYVSNDACAAI